jgi:hypothetical protein
MVKVEMSDDYTTKKYTCKIPTTAARLFLVYLQPANVE